MDEDVLTPDTPSSTSSSSHQQSTIFLCHENFPYAIWSYRQCEAIRNQLHELAQQHCHRILTTTIVGSVMVRFTKEDVLLWLTSLPNKLLSQEAFPNLYTIHLNIPLGVSYTSNTIIKTLCEQNQHLNCHLWEVVNRATEPHLHHLILAIPKECFYNFNSDVKNLINFKWCQLIAPLEFYEKPCVALQDSAKLNQMFSRYVNHLLQQGSSLTEAQQSAVMAVHNAKQMIATFSTDFMAQQIFNDLNFCEETPAVAVVVGILNDESVDILCDKHVIISKKEFPKSFLTYQHSQLIIKGFNFFLNCLPVRPQIGDFNVHVGWLKVSYGDETDLKTLQTLIKLVADEKSQVTFLSADQMINFHFISFCLPSRGSSEQQILNILMEENQNLDFTSWSFIERKSDEFKVAMTAQSFQSLKNNNFKFQYLLTSYQAQFLTNFAKNCPLTQNYTNIQQDYLKYFNNLLDSGVSFDEADGRCLKALESYNVMNLPDNRNSSFLLDRPIFFNVLFTQNIFDSLKLLDEISTESVTKLNNNYVLLCNSDFPKSFLSSYFLHMLKKGLVYFMKRLPVQPAIGNIVLDVGWLKIYYENEAALKTLVKMVQTINDERTALKVIRAKEIPEFKCTVFESFPDNKEGKQTILDNLKMNNSWLNMSLWSVAKREWDKLYITMDPPSFRALQNNSFFLIYKSKAYITKPQIINFPVQPEPDAHNSDTFHFNPIKLKMETNENSVELSTLLEDVKKAQNAKGKRTKEVRVSKQKQKQKHVVSSDKSNRKQRREESKVPSKLRKDEDEDDNSTNTSTKRVRLSKQESIQIPQERIDEMTFLCKLRKEENEKDKRQSSLRYKKRGDKWKEQNKTKNPPLQNEDSEIKKPKEWRKLSSIVRKVEPVRKDVADSLSAKKRQLSMEDGILKGKESRRLNNSEDDETRWRSRDKKKKNKRNASEDSIVNEYFNLIEELKGLSSLLKTKQQHNNTTQ